jgi:hypothetical protein
MNFYEIGYSDYESHPVTILCHDKKFTTEEFNEILLQAYVKANEELKIANKEWFDEWLEEKIQADKELDEGYIEDMRYKPRVSELNYNVIEILIKEHGFKNIDIKQKFIPFDSEILDESNTSCEYINLIRNRFLVVEERDKKLNKVLK